MGLRLLGPPEVVTGGRLIDLGGPRTRTVLVVLALNANRTTPMERLIDAVWEVSPPATARSQIQICVSRLRKLFVRAGLVWAIRSRHPGYVLEIPAADLDVQEFGRLVRLAHSLAGAGRREEATAALRAALELWRGPALSGIAAAAVRGEVALLEEQRLSALEERIQLDLELGRHRELGGELRALVEQYPLRERMQGLLMLALYRSDLQADALAAYRAARDRLAEEIGVEPGAELRQLQQSILARDPSIAAPERTAAEPASPVPAAGPWSTPRQLPASLGDFTGREEQLEVIRRALSAGAGSPARFAMPVVGIFGTGGVGKTSLAIRAAHELAPVFPDGQLYVDLRIAGEETPARLLGRFLRSLGVSGLAIPQDTDERATMYRSLLAGRRVLVVLDGVTPDHQIEPLLPGSAGCAVVVTSRERLGYLPGLVSIDLEVFEPGTALELLGKAAGRDRIDTEPAAAAELVRFCDGLPLALRIAGARLAGRRHWQVQELVGRLASEVGRLDELSHHGQELRSTIGFSYQGMDKPEQRLLRLCALVPTPDFPAWVAAALLDTGLTTAQDSLERLVDAQLLTVVAYPGTRPRYRFHDLIRVYANEQLTDTEPPSDRHAALQRMLSGWMAFVEDAHRLAYGGDFTTIHGTAPRWRPPDVATVELIEPPFHWFERERRGVVAAIRQAAENDLAELCWDIAFTGITLFERGHFDDWQECAEISLRCAERTGNRLGHAAMLHSLGSMNVARTRVDEAERYATRARQLFEALGNVHGQALSIRHLASVANHRGDAELAIARYAESGRLFASVGDVIGQAQTSRSLASYEMDAGNLAKARSMLEHSLSVVHKHHDIRTEAMVHNRLGQLNIQEGDYEAAIAHLQRALTIVREIEDRVGMAYVRYSIGLAQHRHGLLDDARTTLRAAFDAATAVGSRQIMGHASRELGEIAAKTGDPADAVEHLDNAQRNYGELGAAGAQAETLDLIAKIRERMRDSDQ